MVLADLVADLAVAVGHQGDGSQTPKLKKYEEHKEKYKFS